jgi:uncharacterized protein YjbI with pentapeptide repeats
MANAEHLEVLKEGVEAWNQGRVENPGPVDLSGADLIGANVGVVYLSEAALAHANPGRKAHSSRTQVASKLFGLTRT